MTTMEMFQNIEARLARIEMALDSILARIKALETGFEIGFNVGRSGIPFDQIMRAFESLMSKEVREDDRGDDDGGSGRGEERSEESA